MFSVPVQESCEITEPNSPRYKGWHHPATVISSELPSFDEFFFGTPNFNLDLMSVFHKK